MKSDFEYVKKKLEEAPAALPASLQPDEVVRRLREETAENSEAPEGTGTNEPETKPKKGVIRRLLPLVAVAAAVALLVGLLPRVTRNKPADTDRAAPTLTGGETEGKAAPADYSAVARVLKRNKTRSDVINAIDDFFSGWESDSYLLVDEKAADSAVPNAESDTPAAPAITGAAGSEKGYSELNTVEKDVDEADVIRTDGSYIYVLKDAAPSAYYCGFYGAWDMAAETGTRAQTFSIVDPNGGSPALLSSLRLTLTEENATEVLRERGYDGFYLWGDYAILTGSETAFTSGGMRYDEEGQYWDFYGDVKTERTALISIYDLTDKSAPALVRDLYFDGELLETRITGGRLLAVSQWAPYPETVVYDDATTFIPCAGDRDELVPAENITVDSSAEDAGAFVTVSLLDLSDVSAVPQSASVLGRAWKLYCAKNAVYVYGGHSRYRMFSADWTEILDVHKLDISGSTPLYVGKASFENASVLTDYALNEYNGYLRLALHFQKDWTDRKNVAVVLNPDMTECGRSEPFGEDEDIRSVRYDGDMLYVVTFRNTDPLFAVDLSDPAQPVIRGEVKLPGYSAYLHPVAGYMVGVGYGGTETGVDGSAKLSLFDVSDPENPKELDSVVRPDTWFMTEHKAFVPVGEDGFLVLYNSYLYEAPETEELPEETAKQHGGWSYVKVADGKLVEVASAEIDDADPCRALYIGDVVYFYVHVWGRGEWKGDEYTETPDAFILTGYDFATGQALGSLTL